MSDIRPILLCISPFVPYDGIPHAGGQYLYSHLEELAHRFRVRLVAPGTSDNRKALARLPGSIDSLILLPSMDGNGWLRGIQVIDRAIHGVGMDPVFRACFRRSNVVSEWILQAKFIDFEWAQTATLSRYVRVLNPSAVQMLVVHDVLSHRWLREFDRTKGAFRRFYLWLRYVLVRRAEVVLFGLVDRVLVFSESERLQAKSVLETASVGYIPPPLSDDLMPSTVDDFRRLYDRRMRGTLLFVGAMGRQENDEGAYWFLSEVFPMVLRRIPDAKVFIVGGSPSARLKSFASENVVITGYVDDISHYYRRCGVFVGSVFRGGGVKFKTVSALLWGIPVVASTVGSEGIGRRSNYLCVSDDPSEFADAVVQGLSDYRFSMAIAECAFEWAHSEFGGTRFRDVLEEEYPN
ncbi:hypothetical protein C0Z11_02700 [Acidipropionibacterium jensenii]|uniref:glycosyltransferase n=1 Tax=Acidipropionibacterium jensenii TaxID=1749 RepID=UPI000BC338C6|nr:glycosyltransferase family 4 protein [Acidipropionibacterium jensenii]AZZ41376.1 hypothetical protein C0Z11_02700 [Acidipropionibacterium jensenii]